MNIYSISDLHLDLRGTKPMNIFGTSWDNYLEEITQDWNAKVKEDDLVLISGDISWAMTLEEFSLDLPFFQNLNGTIILNRGNHDYWWSSISKIRDMLPPKIFAIQNDCIRFGNFLICGTRGWDLPDKGKIQTEQDKKMILRETERMKISLAQAQKIRKSEDILIYMIHYPPFNIRREQNEFLDLLEANNVNCVVYGHLHGKNVKSIKYENRNGIDFYLTSCDQVQNKLVKLY